MSANALHPSYDFVGHPNYRHLRVLYSYTPEQMATQLGIPLATYQTLEKQGTVLPPIYQFAALHLMELFNSVNHTAHDRSYANFYTSIELSSEHDRFSNATLLRSVTYSLSAYNVIMHTVLDPNLAEPKVVRNLCNSILRADNIQLLENLNRAQLKVDIQGMTMTGVKVLASPNAQSEQIEVAYTTFNTDTDKAESAYYIVLLRNTRRLQNSILDIIKAGGDIDDELQTKLEKVIGIIHKDVERLTKLMLKSRVAVKKLLGNRK